MSTFTLDGIRCSWFGSICRWMAAVPSGRDSIDETVPTCTPRILTLASGFITNPARSEITVTGTVVVKLPRNRPTASATIARIATTVANPASGRTYRAFVNTFPIPFLSRQVEVAVGTVDGQRHQQGHRYDDDQRRAHGVA